jgi:DHA3 family macrolide efflux protein-like MFS transporter
MNKIINWKRQFVVIYTGQAFSILGSAAVQFAIIWWLTVQTESAVTLTIASVVAFLPNMLIGPFAGVWVDRYNRRTVMIAADGLVAVSSAILGVAFWLVPTPPIWFIYLVLFLRGLGSTFHGQYPFSFGVGWLAAKIYSFLPSPSKSALKPCIK